MSPQPHDHPLPAPPKLPKPRANRKAAVLHPVEAHAAQARDTGFTWWQWWVMTPLTLLGAFWVYGLLSGLPMFLYVMYAQLTQL